MDWPEMHPAALQDHLEEASNRRMASEEALRPCVIFRPDLRRDGDQWCALYGEDIQVGLAGFGGTPEEAMRAFDQAWFGDA